jgi:hypothetical protein
VLWVTSHKLRVNRAATAWLVRRFIDRDATFLFVKAADVAETARQLGGVGFHAPNTEYPARAADGRTPFEVLADAYAPGNVVLKEMATLVREADIPSGNGPPEAIGLRLISRAFPLVSDDDHAIVERSAFLYDALYCALENRIGSRSE